MSAEVFACETNDMQEVIDQYLTEDDKELIHSNMKGSKVRSLSKENKFLLYSIAKNVKGFIEDGHYVTFIAFGLDYMISGKSGRFTNSGILHADRLADAVYEYCFEVHQENGGMDEELLDHIYAWLLVTPYAAMSMTEKTRNTLHGIVRFLWLCPITGDKSLSTQCYDHGRLSIIEAIQHWTDNVPIMYKGCGYANIIEPQEC
jgi:hypothetical protein